MKFDQHSEYPVILRHTDEGIIGTWYENQMKPLEQMLEELSNAGKGAEVNVILTYMAAGTLDFKRKFEAHQRTQALAHKVHGYNPFQVVMRVGPAYFEPLANVNWAVSGETTIEWGQAAEDHEVVLDIPDKRYHMVLDGVFLKELAQWNPLTETWVPLELLQLSFGSEMYEQVEGTDLTSTVCQADPGSLLGDSGQ